MKAINGKLDMSKAYELISVEYGELSDVAICQCDNCGNTIKNVAIVKDNTNRKYGIGLDCMQTIINMSPNDKQQAKNTINRKRRFLKELKYAELITVKNNTFWFYVRNAGNNLVIRGRGDYSLYKNAINQLDIQIEFQ